MAEVRTIGVVGLGAMGAGIAQVAIEAGFDVVGREVTAELGESAGGRIGHFLTRKVEKGQRTQEERDAAVARLRITTELDDLAGCDLVIEAIVEELVAKRELFAELERICRPDAVLATNTSALSVTEIAAATSSPERVVGMHFFNPAPLMPLVEIVRAELSSEDAFESAYAVAERMGKTPVRCHDTPGFVVNRVLIPLLNDCVTGARRGTCDARGPRRSDEARRGLADGAVHARRPRGHRRPRARLRGALREAARATHGAARRGSSRCATPACWAARAAAGSTRTSPQGAHRSADALRSPPRREILKASASRPRRCLFHIEPARRSARCAAYTSLTRHSSRKHW